MTKRKVEITDKRVSAQPANGAEPEHTELVDLGEAPRQAVAGAVSIALEATETDDVAALRTQVAEYLDLAQRKEAELRNYAKRTQQDLEDARRFAIESLLEDLFPVLDGLAQAVSAYKNNPGGSDPLLDGVRGTVRAMEAALLKHGIARIDAEGVPYDAEVHQALSVDGEGETEMVAEVYVQGYRLGDKVLKPAMVRVEKR